MTRTQRSYALLLLTAVYTLNLVDRSLMMLLLEPIKRDLSLSDTQMGFISGIAFGLFYAVAGVPLARLADRGDRARLAAVAIGVWGLTVMACLWVGNFIQMVAARIAAAIGEAGCKPPTYSLVGDYFPRPAERTRAMAVYWLSSPLATLIGFVVGGWLQARFGWRMTFFIMGIPGIVLAVIVWTTLREPRRANAAAPVAEVAPPMKTVLLDLWHQPTSRHLCIALVLFYTLGFGLWPWIAAFLIRSHAMTTAEVGLWVGLINGASGIGGVLLGGYVMSRWFATNEAAQLRVTGLIVAAILPVIAVMAFTPQRGGALSMLVVLNLVFNFFFAPTYALLQRLATDRVRATVMSVVMLLANLIGMSIGPQMVGILSDAWAPIVGQDSLRYALLAVAALALWAGSHFWRGARSVTGDLVAVEQAGIRGSEPQAQISRGRQANEAVP